MAASSSLVLWSTHCLSWLDCVSINDEIRGSSASAGGGRGAGPAEVMNSRRLLASGLLSALWWPLLQASSFFLATASAGKAARMASSSPNLADETTASVDNEMEDEDLDELTDDFHWTAATIVQSIVVFCLAGCAEILGGWLVWAAVRGDSSTTGKKPWWYALLGSVVLVICEF